MIDGQELFTSLRRLQEMDRELFELKHQRDLLKHKVMTDLVKVIMVRSENLQIDDIYSPDALKVAALRCRVERSLGIRDYVGNDLQEWTRAYVPHPGDDRQHYDYNPKEVFRTQVAMFIRKALQVSFALLLLREKATDQMDFADLIRQGEVKIGKRYLPRKPTSSLKIVK